MGKIETIFQVEARCRIKICRAREFENEGLSVQIG
jgi:hypothetical protein